MSDSQPKLLLVAEIPENAGRDLDIEQHILGSGVSVERWSGTRPDEAFFRLADRADLMLIDFVKLDSEVFDKLNKISIISVAATGYDCIDVNAAKGAGISVSCVDEYCTEEVADHAITLMLAQARRLLDYDRLVRQQRRWQFDAFSGIQRMSELTLGIIGFGRIGQAVARRAKTFGMRCIAYDPYTQAHNGASSIEWCSLDRLLETSDVITLHCNADESNRNLLDQDAFGKMKRRPVLINVARGELIDEQALAQALDTGQVKSAALDVLSSESPDLDTHPLANRDNVVLTPHVAFYSETSMRRNREISAWNIRHHLDGNHAAVTRYVHHAEDRAE